MQILKKESEEIVECPKCRNKLKCEQCKSKNLIIHDLMSKTESDDLQIRHVIGKFVKYLQTAKTFERNMFKKQCRQRPQLIVTVKVHDVILHCIRVRNKVKSSLTVLCTFF